MSTHERILAVDESGAARKLCISVEEFRAQCPFDPIEGTDGLYYSVDDVAAEMVRRNIPVGTICKGAS